MATPILMVSPLARAGGAERAFANLARNLPSFGFDPAVALLERGPLEGWLDDPLVIEANPTRPLDLFHTARTVRHLAAVARRTGAAVVVSSKTRGHVFAGPAALAARLPSVWWCHEVPPSGWLYRRREPWRRYHVEEAARAIPAARVVCGNASLAAHQRRRTPRLPTATIRPGLPVARVAARRGEGGTLRRRLGLERVPLVGIVARLDRVKGHDLFLDAAARISATRPDVRFPIIGGELVENDRGYGAELRRRADRLRLADRVLFTGHQDDPIPWIDALDVVVVASSAEAGPLVLGEAMTLGRPVVATRVPGPQDIVDDGRSGLLVADRDAAAMADAVLRLLDDPALAARIGSAAADEAGEFCELRMAERFAALLTEVTG